ncbi:MAG: hypothetical protein ABI231_05785 [Candidatus Tumulicola sp.]
MSAVGGVVVPSCVVPYVTVKLPWGVRKTTTAPGMSSLRAVVSSRLCNAAWLIGFNPEPAVGAAVANPVDNPRTTPPSTTLVT